MNSTAAAWPLQDISDLDLFVSSGESVTFDFIQSFENTRSYPVLRVH